VEANYEDVEDFEQQVDENAVDVERLEGVQAVYDLPEVKVGGGCVRGVGLAGVVGPVECVV